MLRTSENKIYRQGISDPSELADGFPVRPEDLFGYAGIIIGSVDADYFTPLQRELLREYVDRKWDDEIVHALTDYIAVPAKSPMFDADWAKHGYIDRVVTEAATWAEAQKIRGLKLEVIHLEAYPRVGEHPLRIHLHPLFGHFVRNAPVHQFQGNRLRGVRKEV